MFNSLCVIRLGHHDVGGVHLDTKYEVGHGS